MSPEADRLLADSVAVKPQLADPPKWMTSGCEAPQPLPRKEMDQKAVEEYWGDDADDRNECRIKYYALRNFYRKRDSALQGKLQQ